MKKEYKKPAIKMVKLENTDIICTSDTATGYRLNYGDEEDTPTVTNSIWDR